MFRFRPHILPRVHIYIRFLPGLHTWVTFCGVLCTAWPLDGIQFELTVSLRAHFPNNARTYSRFYFGYRPCNHNCWQFSKCVGILFSHCLIAHCVLPLLFGFVIGHMYVDWNRICLGICVAQSAQSTLKWTILSDNGWPNLGHEQHLSVSTLWDQSI
jgi:hypothetical protein